jgi:hypothetical protein
MSYCRFSDDNWKSDVYIYESADGYVCHVASNRIVGDVPEVTYNTTAGFAMANRAQVDYVYSAERVSIGGEYDGETRVFSTLQELSDFTGELILAGYHVPVWAIDEIKAEMNSQ